MADTNDQNANEDSGPEKERRRWLDLVLFQFLATMDGLDEVRAVVAPHVDGLDAKRMSAEGLASLASVSPAGRKKLQRFFEKDLERESASTEEAAPTIVTTSNPSTVAANGGSSEFQSPEMSPSPAPVEAMTDDGPRTFLEAFDNDPRLVAGWARRLLHAAMAPRAQILNGSLLTVAVSAFESLIAGVATQRYRLFPDALGDEKEFSLTDLKQYDSLLDAEEAAIARRVESLLRKSLDDWSRWCGKNIGVEIQTIASDYQVVVEALQRRHAIVHNAGRVSRQYLAKCSFPDGAPDLDSPLGVSSEYLETALDHILETGVLTVFLAWMKWGSPPQVTLGEGELLEFVYRLMKSGRWPAVEHVCAVMGSRVTSQGASWVLSVNGWLAQKRQNREVRAPVEGWDVSALDERFSLAKSALLDNYESLFPTVTGMLKSRSILPRDVRDWPLLAEMRADARYGAILKMPEMAATTVDDGGTPKPKELEANLE